MMKLKTIENCLSKHGLEIRFFFDRVKIYIDSSNDIEQIKKLKLKRGSLAIIPRTLSHHDTIINLLDIHHPDHEFLQNLYKTLTGDYVVNYIEVTMDIICNIRQKLRLRKLINEILVFKHKNYDPQFHFGKGEKEINDPIENTYYYGQRSKHHVVLTVYSDKPSDTDKISPCVHIELKIDQAKILKKHDIYSIKDLINFNHCTMWDQYLDLRDINYSEVGRLSDLKAIDKNHSYYSRKGKKLMKRYDCLQDLLSRHPKYESATSVLNDKRTFKKRLEKALEEKCHL